MRLAFSIAMRFLSSSKTQTLLIVMGIAIGVSVQVFIGSLIQGLQKDLVDTTIGSSSQITVSSSENNRVEDWQGIISEIASLDLPTDLTALSASADVPVFISSGDRTLSVLLRGLQFPNHMLFTRRIVASLMAAFLKETEKSLSARVLRMSSM